MNRILMLVAVAVAALAIGLLMVRFGSRARPSNFTIQTLQPVDAPLAANARDSCWFKVKNRSGRADQVRLWASVSSTGARTERLGDLLIVTGAMEPPVHGDRFYGCSLFEYTPGSPVVMTAKTSPVPVRADNVIPFGFSADGKKQQR